MGDWCPGAVKITSSHNGGSMTGGPPRKTWHSYEANPHTVSASAGAHSLINAGNEVHLVFNPISGDLCQILPASVAGRGLVNLSGGVETNRMGSVNIQTEVIAFAKDPWTDYITQAGLDTLAVMMDWIRSFDIPDVWPSGPPPAYPPGDGNRSTSNWQNKKGHYSHSQVPENTHGDPGAIDINVLFGANVALTDADANLVVDKLLSRTIHTGWGETGIYDSTPGYDPTVGVLLVETRKINALLSEADLAATIANAVAAKPISTSNLNAIATVVFNAGGHPLDDSDVERIVNGVVAALPPASTGGLTVADVKDAVTQVLREGVSSQPVG